MPVRKTRGSSKLCGEQTRKKANYCGNCGEPLAAQKAADSLRAAGFYAAADPQERDVIFKTMSSNVLAKGSRHIRDAELDALRGMLDSPDPQVRLTAEAELFARRAA